MVSIKTLSAECELKTNSEPRFNHTQRLMKYSFILIGSLYILITVVLDYISVSGNTSTFPIPVRSFIDQPFRVFFDYYLVLPVLILCVSILSIVAAIREKPKQMKWCKIFLFIITAINVLVGILMVYLTLNVVWDSPSKFERDMFIYEDDLIARQRIDEIQSSLDCCGYNTSSDWRYVSRNSNLSTEYLTSMNAPGSCCYLINFGIQCSPQIDHGCKERLESIMISHAIIFMIYTLATGAALGLTLILATILEKKIKETQLKSKLPQSLINSILVENEESGLLKYSLEEDSYNY